MFHARPNRIVEEARRFDESLGDIAKQLDTLYKQVKLQGANNGLQLLRREALSTTVFIAPKFDARDNPYRRGLEKDE